MHVHNRAMREVARQTVARTALSCSLRRSHLVEVLHVQVSGAVQMEIG